MKDTQIIIKISTAVLAPYEITLEELTDRAGYPKRVVNEEYQKPIGNPKMENPQYIPPEYEMDENGMPVTDENGEMMIITPAIGEPEIDNPDYVPAVGEPEMDNPDSREKFAAKKITEVGLQSMVNKALEAKREEARQALRMIDQQEKAIVADIISQAEITVVE